MPLPAGFFQFGNVAIRLTDVSAVEAFLRKPATYAVRVYMSEGSSFTQEFNAVNTLPTADEASRDAVVAALEAAL